MYAEKTINRDNVNSILKLFAKEYKKTCGKTPSEFIIVGGGSILLNYHFRDATLDLDAMISAASGSKDAIANVARQMNLEPDWLNSDFIYTSSFSNKLTQISTHYLTLNNGAMEIRTVKAEYLIAMKAISARDYGHDISDIVGILREEALSGNHIDIHKIDQAIDFLYAGRNMEAYIRNKLIKYTNMTPDELLTEYQRLIKSAEILRAEIIDKVKEDDINLTRNNIKEISKAIYLKQKNHNQSDTVNNMENIKNQEEEEER